jgi:hypothetical protein
MPSPGWELQKSIHAKLTSDATVTALLGGDRVYDDVPRGADFPYLTFGQSTVRDWSTGTELGSEHILTLHIWSQANGERETHEIMGAVREALHDAAITVDGHHLVNLRHEFSDAVRDPDGEIYHGVVRYRAVTEPAS